MHINIGMVVRAKVLVGAMSHKSSKANESVRHIVGMGISYEDQGIYTLAFSYLREPTHKIAVCKLPIWAAEAAGA